MIKTADEIVILKRGGVILSSVLRELRAACVVGAHTAELDALAERRMREAGGSPSFKGYRVRGVRTPFPGSVCISINDEVVHGLPVPDRVIQEGDVVGLDIGMWYNGLATDMATTVMVGSVSSAVQALVHDTRASLVAGIEAIRAGGWVSDISMAIERVLAPKKYGIVRDLVGHGVGHAVHEEPSVPNFFDRRLPRVKLQEGMVLAIEPMVALGGFSVAVKDDEWTIVTQDGSVAAHFEVTVAVTKQGYDLVTPWPDM